MFFSETIDTSILQGNYLQVRNDMEDLVEIELERMLECPQLMTLLLRSDLTATPSKSCK